MATRVRDWATVDYYEALGVTASASGDEIARAFRNAAKQSHPDASDDPDAAERFKDLATAYTVLSDHRTRRDYDRVRAASSAPAPVVRPAPRPGATRTKPTRWTRKRAWTALIGGVVLTVLGLIAFGGTWYLHDRDANERARFVAVTAQRIDNGQITFAASNGRTIVTREPQQHGEGSGSGPTVKVRYDPLDPKRVIVDADTLGRDITFAIVAAKLLIGGLVFAILGARYLRRSERAATDAR